MTPDKWVKVWRIAVVVLLAWIGVELHLFRGQASWGLDYRTEQLLNEIERNTRR